MCGVHASTAFETLTEAYRSEPYDPYVSGGAANETRTGGGSTQNPKIAEIQAQIDDTRNVMQENIRSMQQRGETLSSLQDKTENLSVSAQGFRRGANKVRKQMWWKDMKMRIAIIVGLIIIVLLIVLPIVFKH